ncbi:MAG: hypothetical protein Q9175_003322 [Cornicularia normoerica]
MPGAGDDGGDSFLVGYSRGAFIARSISGMKSRYGLMRKSTEITNEDADLLKLYKAYKKKQDGAGGAQYFQKMP